MGSDLLYKCTNDAWNKLNPAEEICRIFRGKGKVLKTKIQFLVEECQGLTKGLSNWKKVKLSEKVSHSIESFKSIQSSEVDLCTYVYICFAFLTVASIAGTWELGCCNTPINFLGGAAPHGIGSEELFVCLFVSLFVCQLASSTPAWKQGPPF